MKEYVVFVSSPSDTKEERSVITEIIDEINWYYEPVEEIPRLKLLDLENNVRSKITGLEPQAIIDEQIKGYDVFIGIFRNKFGTPTEKYGSGTEQEFYNAWEKYNENPDSVEISFYFCSKLPSDKKEVNMEDLMAINKFKEKIGNEGFYKEYDSIKKFKEIIRADLRNFVLEKRFFASGDDLEDKIDGRIGNFANELANQIRKS